MGKGTISNIFFPSRLLDPHSFYPILVKFAQIVRIIINPIENNENPSNSLKLSHLKFLIFLLYTGVDSIVIYNLRILGSNPDGSKKKKLRALSLYRFLSLNA